MPLVYKKKTDRKEISPERLKAALDCYGNKKCLREASRNSGIPRTTLRRIIKEKNNPVPKPLQGRNKINMPPNRFSPQPRRKT